MGKNNVGCLIFGLVLAIMVLCIGAIVDTAARRDVAVRSAESMVEQQRQETEQLRIEAMDAQDRRQWELIQYMFQKSEERQDEMLYFIMNGETTEERAARTVRTLAGVIVIVLAGSVAGAWVVSQWESRHAR